MILDDLTPLMKSSQPAHKSRLVTRGARSVMFYAIARVNLPRIDLGQALLAVKMLGKHPAGSEVVASRANLISLLAMFTTFKESDFEAANEALKCIANALLLIETARNRLVQRDVGGSEVIVELLEVRSSPQRFTAFVIYGLSSPENKSPRTYLPRIPYHLSGDCVSCKQRLLHPQSDREQTSGTSEQHH